MNYEEEDSVNKWSGGCIKVMWNFKRYPVPKGVDISLIYDNIESVCEEKHNFTAKLEIMAYGIQPNECKLCRSYGIICEYFPDDTTMTLDILYRTKDNPVLRSERMNIALITQNNEEDSELRRILECLASRNHTVFLVEPPEVDKPFDFNNAKVLKGGSRPQSVSSPDVFIENFSLPLLRIPEPKVGIFWDAKDFPFPGEVRDPDLMYYDIVKSLEDKGDIDGKKTIWAYVDETEEYWKDKLVNKTWKASIHFLPRVEGLRMFHDVLLWIKDTPEAYTPFDWSIVILNEPGTCDNAVVGWLRTFNTRCRRIHPDNYRVFWVKLSVLLESESESESESERESEQGSSKRAKLY